MSRTTYTKYFSMIKIVSDYKILAFIQSLNKLLRVGRMYMTDRCFILRKNIKTTYWEAPKIEGRFSMPGFKKARNLSFN